jgi:cytochrome c peroxidase
VISPLRRSWSTSGAALVIAALTASGCSEPDESQILLGALEAKNAQDEDATKVEAKVDINPRLLRRFQPLRSQLETPNNSLTTAKVELGRALFYDARLSKNQDVSCNTCHNLAAYGVDGLPTSQGHRGQHGTRNAPTVYNAAGHFAQFWDGRMETVEQQALGPILNPLEMALPSEKEGLRVLKSIPQYREWFKQAFPQEPDPITFVNVGYAIGAFERGLTTPSRWDDYLRGNQAALDARELEGLKLFTNIGCMVCHTGEFVGGAMYQKVGIVEAWPNQKDQGRFEVTKQETDRMMFKVPSLRNIAKTAPYFHDGSVATLDEAVRRMARYQLGLTLSDDEVSQLLAWLGSLTGQLPVDYLKAPSLPPSGAETPPPDPT